jgi:hypothetical protein
MDIILKFLNVAKMPRYSTDESKPKRHGKIWDEKEENFVLKRVHEKATFETIANEVQRTIGGVHSHLKELAYRFIENEGKLIEEASELTGLTIQDIQDHIERKNIAKRIREQKGLIYSKEQDYPIQEESLIDLVKEIRDLLKILVLNNK